MKKLISNVILLIFIYFIWYLLFIAGKPDTYTLKEISHPIILIIIGILTIITYIKLFKNE